MKSAPWFLKDYGLLLIVILVVLVIIYPYLNPTLQTAICWTAGIYLTCGLICCLGLLYLIWPPNKDDVPILFMALLLWLVGAIVLLWPKRDWETE